MDGVEVSITTSKIISEDEKKDEEMRFLRQGWVAAEAGGVGRGGGRRGGSVYGMKRGVRETPGNKPVLLEVLNFPTHPPARPGT